MLLTTIALAHLACGDPGESPGADRTQSASFAHDEVSLGAALAQLRGHHRASLEAYEAGDQKTAVTHAFHPVHEIMESIRADLTPQHADDLAAALDEGADAVDAKVPAGRLAAIYARASALTSKALQGAVGTASADSSFRASVVASLLNTAAHEYEEAAPDGELVLVAEYQDGYAFVREARSLFDEFAGEVSGASSVEEELARLEKLLPTLDPPADLPDPDEVEGSVTSAMGFLETQFGATLPEEDEPAEVAEDIEDFLDEVASAYADGNSARASELAAQAYLEHYEVIEPDVIEHAPDINDDLEPLLGAELRRQIEAGVSDAEIDLLIVEAKRLLGQAVEALE